MAQETTGQPVLLAGGIAPPPVAGVAAPVQNQPRPAKPTLTVWQANLLVAGLAGFWGRKADGHPGPDIMGRGLLLLEALVGWERSKRQHARQNAPPRQPRRKPGPPQLAKLPRAQDQQSILGQIEELSSAHFPG